VAASGVKDLGAASSLKATPTGSIIASSWGLRLKASRSLRWPMRSRSSGGTKTASGSGQTGA
jgi:hypothetical protein